MLTQRADGRQEVEIAARNIMPELRDCRHTVSTTQSVRFSWMKISRAPFHQDDDNGVEIVW